MWWSSEKDHDKVEWTETEGIKLLYLKPNPAWESLLLCDFINWGYALAALCQPDWWLRYLMMFPSDLDTFQSVWVNKNWIMAELEEGQLGEFNMSGLK